MKHVSIVILAAFLLASCNGWFFQPSPYNPPTPFLPPTNTPSIVTPTPMVIGVNSPTPLAATSTPLIVNTNTPFGPPTDTPSSTATVLVPRPDVNVQVLGCNTSIDITHGMGEVTNAYATIKNTGNTNLINLRATLIARDEGREHPDKTIELASLPVGYQVTIKLTVDSTYRQETPIQIEVSADGGLFQRLGAESCRDIGLFAPSPSSLNTPVPANP